MLLLVILVQSFDLGSTGKHLKCEMQDCMPVLKEYFNSVAHFSISQNFTVSKYLDTEATLKNGLMSLH